MIQRENPDTESHGYTSSKIRNHPDDIGGSGFRLSDNASVRIYPSGILWTGSYRGPRRESSHSGQDDQHVNRHTEIHPNEEAQEMALIAEADACE